MTDYKVLFESIEKSLLAEGSKTLPLDQIQENLDKFKHFENRLFSDFDYYRILVNVTFFAGFRASIVNAKLNTIHKHLPDFETVSDYGEQEIRGILADKNMIRNRRKVKGCIENAKLFRAIIQKHGSFQKYIESFNGKESSDSLLLLKEDLESKFAGLGKVTVYHFLTDIGFPVLKPDRVICRIFERLDLIDNREQIHQAVLQGRKFAEATGHPIRYIDIVFVAYGQVKSSEFGIERGICLENKPLCHLCGAKNFCNYYSQQSV